MLGSVWSEDAANCWTKKLFWMHIKHYKIPSLAGVPYLESISQSFDAPFVWRVNGQMAFKANTSTLRAVVECGIPRRLGALFQARILCTKHNSDRSSLDHSLTGGGPVATKRAMQQWLLNRFVIKYTNIPSRPKIPGLVPTPFIPGLVPSVSDPLYWSPTSVTLRVGVSWVLGESWQDWIESWQDWIESWQDWIIFGKTELAFCQ